MSRRARLLVFAVLALSLAGCGSNLPIRTLERLTGAPPGVKQDEMQHLVAAGADRLILRLPQQNMSSLLLEAGNRDGVRRWRTLDNVQIYTKDGQIIGTRGLGHDLMSADIGTAELIAAGRAGQGIRIHRALDGEDRLEIRSYVCDVRTMGQERIQVDEAKWMMTLRVDEICHSPRGGMENRHWVADGRVIRSISTFSDPIGPLELVFMP